MSPTQPHQHIPTPNTDQDLIILHPRDPDPAPHLIHNYPQICKQHGTVSHFPHLVAYQPQCRQGASLTGIATCGSSSVRQIQILSQRTIITVPSNFVIQLGKSTSDTSARTILSTMHSWSSYFMVRVAGEWSLTARVRRYCIAHSNL